MRLSTLQIHQQAARQMQDLGVQTAETQSRISTGKRLINPSDDPAGAARVVDLGLEIDQRAQYVSNIDAADAQLEYTDTVVQQVSDVLLRVRELALQAGSGVQTIEDRQYLAAEIRARFEELLTLANTQNAAGQYLFSGFQSETEPFVGDAAEVVYQGDQGVRNVQIDSGLQISINDPGSRVFQNIPSPRTRVEVLDNSTLDADVGQIQIVDQDALDALYPDQLVIEFNDPALAGGANNYTVRRVSDRRPLDGLVNVPFSGNETLQVQGLSLQVSGTVEAGDKLLLGTTERRSVFATVSELADTLENVDQQASPVAFQEAIDFAIASMENATENLLEVRAGIGARLQSLTAVRNNHQDLVLQLEEVRSEIEDLDFAEAVSDLSYQSFVLEAAQQSFIRINGLSLFNRL